MRRSKFPLPLLVPRRTLLLEVSKCAAARTAGESSMVSLLKMYTVHGNADSGIVEDETHCEFVALRNFLTRTHLQDLIETTSFIHYESFRAKQLLALREGGGYSGGSRPISPSADRELSRSSQRMTMNGY